eukprot:11909_6
MYGVWIVSKGKREERNVRIFHSVQRLRVAMRAGSGGAVGSQQTSALLPVGLAFGDSPHGIPRLDIILLHLPRLVSADEVQENRRRPPILRRSLDTKGLHQSSAIISAGVFSAVSATSEIPAQTAGQRSISNLHLVPDHFDAPCVSVCQEESFFFYRQSKSLGVMHLETSNPTERARVEASNSCAGWLKTVRRLYIA